MVRVMVSSDDLPLLSPPGRGPLPGRHLFEGASFGLAHLSLTLSESPPGQGTRLHRHEAEELIIVHSGRGTYTVGDTTVEAVAGDVVIIPSGTPHKWVNLSQEPLVHTGIFSTDHFAMEIVDD